MQNHGTAALLTIVLCSTSLADAPTGADGLSGFSAQYEARYAAFSGDVTMELQAGAGADEYVYRVTTRARGMARLIRKGTATETARFRFADGVITPLQYEIDDGTKAGEDNMQVQFDWAAGVADSTYENDSVQLSLAADIRDRLTTDLFVMRALRSGNPPTTFRIAEKNAIRDYEFNFLGTETVAVPAGSFDTVKYLRQRVGSSRATVIWFAPELDFLPVRLEQLKRGKTTIKTVATRIELDRD